jgi:LAO/AO transport system kinase
MQFSDDQLLEGVLASDLRAIARAITLIENHSPRARTLSPALFRHTGRAFVLGVTGAPGAGKSTLVDQLAVEYRRRGKRVAILAIDPTSPFSGGAILGDRIRMGKTEEDPDIFLRSMATRGALGGLSRATFEAITVLDAAGYDIVLVETVGVGQVEVDVIRTVHTCLVVLVPGMGDSVQTFKAGILEIADLFVINKADRDGTDMLQRDLRLLISLADRKQDDWETKIVRTIATTGEGTAELVDRIVEHQAWLSQSQEGAVRRLNVTHDTVLKLLTDRFLSTLLQRHGSELSRLVAECVQRRSDPYSVVESLIEAWTHSEGAERARE